jgi:hypothetical protein
MEVFYIFVGIPCSTMIQSIHIKFNSQALPAPYAHDCDIHINFSENDDVLVKASLLYVGRDSLTQEEIWEEGFSGEDDFFWEGKLEKVWQAYLQEALDLKDSSASSPGEAIEIIATSNKEKVYIHNKRHWIYIMQEILQAIYETAYLEAPLLLKYRRNSEFSLEIECTFHYIFQYLKVSIEIRSKEGMKLIEGDWKKCAVLLREIFVPDYLTEKQELKDPTKPGIFIDPGEGVWYHSEHAIKTGKNRYPVEKIEEIIDSIILPV